MPLALWAVNIQELLGKTLDQLERGARVTDQLRSVIEGLPPLPSAAVQGVIAAHEQDVQRGEYAVQVKASAKFDLREKALVRNVTLQKDWKAIKNAFDVEVHQDHKRVIRRSMVSERGFRPNWESSFLEAEFLFQSAFDLFCQKWDLYGMQGDRPLLQRVTVHLTPNGTMIFIPAKWSLDGKRDLNWSEIQKLHGLRVTSKQGEKLLENQNERLAEAAYVYALNEEAKRMKLRGDKRIFWVASQMKWSGDYSRKLNRILKRHRSCQMIF